MFLYKRRYALIKRNIVMVAGISGNYSPRTLDFVKNELTSVVTDNGEITDEAKASLSADATNLINYFGNNKNILSGRIDDLIGQNEAKTNETSKEASPDMDLSLDDIDVPKPKNI